MKEINARKEQVMDKTAALSTAKEELAHSKHELGMTKKQLSADEAFLVDLGAVDGEGGACALEARARDDEEAAVCGRGVPRGPRRCRRRRRSLRTRSTSSG